MNSGSTLFRPGNVFKNFERSKKTLEQNFPEPLPLEFNLVHPTVFKNLDDYQLYIY
jgi:hypothetical protein